jgi:amino acid transporter
MSAGKTTTEIRADDQPGPPGPSGLTGRLGTSGIVFSVVAWAAPLLVVVGLMPSMIGFSGTGIVAGFVVTTIVLLLFSVGFTAITRYVDRPGAFYAYVTAGIGKASGLGGAFVAVFGYSLLVLSTWVAFGVYLRDLVADTFGGPAVPWWVMGLVGVAAAGVFAYLEIELSAKALTIALVLEVALMLVFDFAVFADGGPDGVSVEPFTWHGATTGNFGLAILYAALCFIGFESSAIYREEARNPDVTIPRATYVSVVLIGVFYCVAAWAMITALGASGVSSAQGGGDVSTMFGDLGTRYVSHVVPDIVNVLVITSTFACLLASHNAVARYGYSLGRDGVLPRRLGAAHPRFRSPYVASGVLTVLEVVAVVVIAAATGFQADGADAFTVYVRVNGLGAIAVVFLMCLVSAAVLVYFNRHPTGRGARALWRTRVAPGLGLIGLLVMLALGLKNVGLLIGGSSTVAALMTLAVPIVFVAGICHARALRRRKPAVYEQIGRQ